MDPSLGNLSDAANVTTTLMAVVVVMLPASSLEQESQQTAQSLALRVAPLNERAPKKSSEPPRKTVDSTGFPST